MLQWDYRKDWEAYAADEIPSKSKLPDFLYALLEEEGTKTALDLGCGTGKFAIELHKRGYSVVGVDINPKAIEKAKIEAEKIVSSYSANSLKFYIGDATNLHLQEAPFDAIIMQLVISIIGNAEDRKKLLQTARSLLKPNGTLYFSASGVSDDINPKYVETYKKDLPTTGEKYTYLSRDQKGKTLYVTHHFTEKELLTLLSKNFKDINIRKEKETSSRRPDEVAYFLYVTAKAK